MRLLLLIFLLTSAVCLAGCASSGAPGGDAAGRALESHLRALAGKDDGAFAQTLCSEWEDQAYLEFDAYRGVAVELKDLACSSTPGQQQATGSCKGRMLLSYGSEHQVVELSERAYRLVQAESGWLVCGYTPAGGTR